MADHAAITRTSLPAMSVVTITPDGYATIRTLLQHLHTQSVKHEIELVIVAPAAADIARDAPVLQGFWDVAVVPFGNVIAAPAAARAAGVRAARGAIVAFVEDHCFPQAGWAEALIAAHRQPYAAVGPAVGNANPGSAISWANLLIEYAPWLDPASGGLVEHLPGHNSSYKRAVLLEYGDRLEALLQAESILHWDLHARGHQLRLEPAARALHLNYSGAAASVRLRLHGGRLFAATRARHWPVAKRVAYAAAGPLIALVRLRRILRQVRQRRVATLPHPTVVALALLLFCDAAGQVGGYLCGAGAAAGQAGRFEFHENRQRVPQAHRQPGRL